jgi:hypothetical protein
MGMVELAGEQSPSTRQTASGRVAAVARGVGVGAGLDAAPVVAGGESTASTPFMMPLLWVAAR